MKKITFLLSFIFLNAYFLFSQDDKIALDMLNSMSDNYKKMNGFTSSFTYTMKNLSEDITDSFSGKISVRDDKVKEEIKEKGFTKHKGGKPSPR